MDKISKIYFINLDRRPDRYEHFLKQCHDNNIDYNKITRFRAIDGKTYEFNKEEKDMFKNVDYRTQNFAKRIMGNQLSHYNILKEMVDKNYNYIIIFQDDIQLRNDFISELEKVMNNVPENAEIINIAFHKFASYNQFIPWDLKQRDEEKEMAKININDYVCILNDTVNPCSLGYIVTLKGAINLINYFETKGFLRATDWNFNDYLRNKNIFYGSSLVLCTGNPNLGSDIFI
jgi:GR25 family glycosyltransferase involved in LPS biosynthesis